MSHCKQPGPLRQGLCDILNIQKASREDNVKKPKVERQFGRISDPNASWILVTGFPRPAIDRILFTFRTIGRIVGKHWCKEGLHLQFSNPCESARAVELNDLCIAGYPVRIQAIPRISAETKCCGEEKYNPITWNSSGTGHF